LTVPREPKVVQTPFGGGGGAPYGSGGGTGANGGRLIGGAYGGGNIGLNGLNGYGVHGTAGGLAGRAIVDPDGYITLTGSGQVLGS